MPDALRAGDLEAARLDPAEHALMQFVATVTRHAYKVSPEAVEALRDFGWTEPQIAECVYITALFAFFNRVADAFGIAPEAYGVSSNPEEPSDSSQDLEAEDDPHDSP